MALPIEEYALIGDCKSAALVGADGSVDWLCWPRFDSPACFAGLLGSSENGRWLIAPTLAPRATKRRYRSGVLILETEFQSETGSAVLVDFMPADVADLVRIVVGRSGRVDFRTEYVARFNYGASVPWVRQLFDGAISAVAGPKRLVLRSQVLRSQIPLSGEDLKTVGDFTVEEGQSVAFVLSYGASFQAPPNAIDPFNSLERTEAFWRGWSDRCPDVGPRLDRRSGDAQSFRRPGQRVQPVRATHRLRPSRLRGRRAEGKAILWTAKFLGKYRYPSGRSRVFLPGPRLSTCNV